MGTRLWLDVLKRRALLGYPAGVLPFPPAPRLVALAQGGGLTLIERFLAPTEEEEVLRALLAEVPFRQNTIRMFGAEVLEPRLVAYHGEPSAVYTYSGRTHVPVPFTPTLGRLRARVERAAGVPFNAVLVNQYRDGQDSMGYHADDEPELGPDPVIASLSLGGSRTFVLAPKKKSARADRVSLELTGGSLLIMHAGTQRAYVHALPKRKAAGLRLNLTFRLVAALPRI